MVYFDRKKGWFLVFLIEKWGLFDRRKGVLMEKRGF
jgi:hypothetical protein